MNSQPSLFACLGIVVICIATALESAVKLSSERYVAGKADCYEVLEAQQQLFPAQPNLARTQRDELLALVALYKSLGGGWQEARAEISQITKPLKGDKGDQSCLHTSYSLEQKRWIKKSLKLIGRESKTL